MIGSILMMGVSLSIQPLSGDAPLTIHPIEIVSGPFIGAACLSYIIPGDRERTVVHCESVNLPKASMRVSVKPPPMILGLDMKEKILKFQARLFEAKDDGSLKTLPSTTSNRVEVRVK